MDLFVFTCSLLITYEYFSKKNISEEHNDISEEHKDISEKHNTNPSIKKLKRNNSNRNITVSSKKNEKQFFNPREQDTGAAPVYETQDSVYGQFLIIDYLDTQFF